MSNININNADQYASVPGIGWGKCYGSEIEIDGKRYKNQSHLNEIDRKLEVEKINKDKNKDKDK